MKRLATQAGLRWKRVSKSLKSCREPEAFDRGKRAREAVHKHEDTGQRALYYCDAAGCALNPPVPSAWHPSRDIIEIPASTYGRVHG